MNMTRRISAITTARAACKVAYRKEQKWFSEVVDQGFVGFTSSLQIHDGTIWLTYSGGPGGGLKFARRRL